MVSEKIFQVFTHYKSMENTLLHTKYISCGIHGFREKIFQFFPINKSMDTLYPLGASLDPRGLTGRIYVRDH